MPKKLIRLSVKTRKENKGFNIASVPLQKLAKSVKATEKSKRWSYEEGWLVLEAI